jgi:tyrosyl-tRNA synthetase
LWLNAGDTDAEKWIKIFTFLDKHEIENLITDHRTAPEKRILQKKLAEEITVFVHGNEDFENALQTTDKLFSQQTLSVDELSEQDLEQMEGIIKIDISRSELKQGIDVVSFLANTQIFPSKGEARKMVQNGGISINRTKVDNLQLTLDDSLLLHQQYLLIQKGKKNYYLIKAV